ncbi:DMT family transporter [Conexibacter sp. SYSU D00693]|uniref:DMT family transporter n=1 Tax=Conexibacter sp. SYSU D00693 TaxID=2812560 RepID=UPI00196AB109|nr:DMT family transporter [Conexibacter sp. SYSU D00693]
MLAIVLSLAASLAYGLSDFIGGLKSRSQPLIGVLLVSQAAGLVLLVVAVAVHGEGPPGDEFVWLVLAAGVAEALGVSALYRGLAVGRMSVVSPVAATAPVVPVCAAIALGELPSALQALGVVLAATGIALTVLTGEGAGDEGRRAGALRTSVVLGLLSALGFGAFFVAVDAASEHDVPWALLGTRATTLVLVGLAAVVALRRSRRVRVERAALPAVASIGALIVAADAGFAVASTEGLLSVVSVLSALYPLVTVALAAALLGERLTTPQRAGVACAFGGIVLVSVG